WKQKEPDCTRPQEDGPCYSPGGGKLLFQFLTKVRSSEFAQTSRNVGVSEATAACPLYSMRNVLSQVTLPICCAPTLYCLAAARTAASFSGETGTMARAPDSLKRANSAGTSPASVIAAPNEGEAKHASARATAKPPSLRSWAEFTEPASARATRQSCRFFS